MKTTRMLTAAATTVALGLSVLTASPAEAAVTRSFSVSAYDGAAWGTVTFNNYSWTVDAYIYRDSSASITLKICGWQTLDNGNNATLVCKSASNGGSIGSTRHVTTLGATANWAQVFAATADLYVNGSYVTGQWVYKY
ncbi:hypothetical protein Aple_022780 [Acrocarpospora pleiomorpha]|uniref:Uncharacterized protein n=1 Tax=Acrocarpospora pleiomorpha TaxID=90975 RepID=A0A5M3XF63_9ACTN|nr:hypothetical protein [Acrocarpospora pleiomorpha]GES19382.1 hypothetical protein Aple_022780 [Acrocarpospora pleiomorpha]